MVNVQLNDEDFHKFLTGFVIVIQYRTNKNTFKKF